MTIFIKINVTFIMETDPESQNDRSAAPCVNYTLAKNASVATPI